MSSASNRQNGVSARAISVMISPTSWLPSPWHGGGEEYLIDEKLAARATEIRRLAIRWFLATGRRRRSARRKISLLASLDQRRSEAAAIWSRCVRRWGSDGARQRVVLQPCFQAPRDIDALYCAELQRIRTGARGPRRLPEGVTP